MSTTTPATRFYVKCGRCLTPMAVELVLEVKAFGGLEAAARKWARGGICACGGSLDLMGLVLPARRGLSLVDERCACDQRCTGATGPSCECICGGKNHGTSAVVEVVYSVGAAPKLLCPEKALAAAQEFLAAEAAAGVRMAARFGEVKAKVKAGVRVPESTYFAWRDAVTQLVAARNLRSHKGRLKALALVVL